MNPGRTRGRRTAGHGRLRSEARIPKNKHHPNTRCLWFGILVSLRRADARSGDPRSVILRLRDLRDLRGLRDLRAFTVGTGSSTVCVDETSAQRSPSAFDRFGEIVLVHFNADEIQAELGGGDGGAAEAEEWVQGHLHPRQAVELEAVLGEARRERRGVGAILVPVLDGVVGDEPGVAAAAAVLAAGLPAGDVRRVLVRHPNRAPIERRVPLAREMKDELVAVFTNRGLLIGL